MEDKFSNIIFLGFSDNKLPEFKEVRGREWISFGEDNKFPNQLLYLYDKSSNHNAILNGKVTYIMGKGFQIEGTKLNEPINRHGENFNKVMKKFCADVELFGGGYLEVIWNKSGGISDLCHMPFQCLRKSKTDDGYYHKKDWAEKYNSKDEVFIPKFDINKKFGSQVFSYMEYRPGIKEYPLPGYFGALNDIETDVEISKYNLSVIKNGMFSSKMISFFNGEPTKEIKREIEKDFKKKFAGAENSGNFMLVFNTDPAKAPQVQDLSTTDLDKLFDQLNKTVQGEIFSAHLVTSPILFGITQPGALGNRNEMQDAYEIFKNTYVNDKQQALEEVAKVFCPFYGLQEVKIEPVSVIGFKPSDEAIEKTMTPNEIRDFAGLPPIAGGDEIEKVNPAPTVPVNENIKNLTGRQNQQLLRVLRQYERQKLTREQAATLLKTSLALSDEEIDVLLKKETFEKFDSEYTEFEVADMFEEIGEKKENFTIVKSKPQRFEKEIFADVSQIDSNILNLIGKDKRITPEVIAKTLKTPVAYVKERIEKLTKEGVLITTPTTIGVDTIIEHSVNQETIDYRPPAETIDVYVKYSYEAKPGLEPIIETTRPFCKKLIQLDRLYTRAEIESISQRVGYSVFDRKGGFWGSKEECRHRWMSSIVIKKRT